MLGVAYQTGNGGVVIENEVVEVGDAGDVINVPMAGTVEDVEEDGEKTIQVGLIVLLSEGPSVMAGHGGNPTVRVVTFPGHVNGTSAEGKSMFEYG